MPGPDNALEDWINGNSSSVKLFTHDFRNPISAIITNLSYIKTVLEDADEDTREAIEDSIQAVNSLLAMIGNGASRVKVAASDVAARLLCMISSPQ